MNPMRTANTNKERLLSREAASAIVKRRFCTDVGPNKVAQVSVAGVKGTSISRYDAEAGRAASQQYGPSDDIVDSGAAVPAGVEVCSDNQGRAVDVAGAASGAWILGKNRGGQALAADVRLAIQFYDSLTARQKP